MLDDERSDRKPRHHYPPFWVEDNAIFFLTINCQQRGKNQLAQAEIANQLIAAWLYYRDHHGCAPLLIVLMPDHLHLLISFSWQEGEGMPALIKSWKRFTAKQCDIHWQRDYFDHRIRNKEDLDDKWDYIVNNPIKAGLATHTNDWPYKWIHPDTTQGEYL